MRKIKNTDRVIDAMHDLVQQGHVAASPSQLARHSGVSTRSILRFFPTTEDLLLAVFSRQAAGLAHLSPIPDPGARPLEDRVSAYVGHQFDVYRAMTPLSAIIVPTAKTMPRLREAIVEHRSQLLAMTRDHFRPELNTMPQPRRSHTELGIHLMCQHESINTLLHEQALPDDDARALLIGSIHAVLHHGLEANSVGGI